MVLPTKVIARIGSALLHKTAARAATTTTRSFTSRARTSGLYTTGFRQPQKVNRYARFFSNTTVCKDQTQPAPNAKAYLESGVIKGTENPVNVKKVLVIGSGGLSIGQAGEFDYSGMFVKECFLCRRVISRIRSYMSRSKFCS